AEKQELLANFIDTYNPYGIKELIEQAETANNTASLVSGITPYWKSDSDSSESGQQMATHQLITLEAMLVFMSDYGFYNVDSATQLILALYIAAASGLPDLDEREYIFAGHFYDPNTGLGLNALYKSARTNVSNHFYDAYEGLSSNPYMAVNSQEFADVLEKLGRALHYIQDVCEPHHAANIAALPPSTHSSFEKHVEDNIDVLLPAVTTISQSYYLVANTKTAADLTHDAALTGRANLSYVFDVFNKEKWDEAGTNCLRNAVYHSARLIYKLFADCGVVQ
ncbi:MAG: hypothetical protein ACI4LI_03450, partial [Candidatus Fimenecus sp.]